MRNKSLLLVDDEDIILKAIGMDLRQKNYDVMLANNGETAISFMGEWTFDLIVTDLSMPGLDGIQVLKEAKKIDILTGVIILTGYGDMTTAIDALRLGADDYLLKPCDTDELLIRIEHCLKKREAFQKLNLYEKLLPVCSYCKSIRDDTGTERGKGKWMRMEEYLYRRGGIELTHSVCDACFEKHEND